MKKSGLNVAPFCLFLVLLCAMPLTANAKLLIMPTYVVFEDRDRTQDITIMNTSNETATYRMGWLHYKQNEDGLYQRLSEPLNPEFDPETMIVFSPRQVRLPPKGRQRVRMSLRKPPNLPDGEYRAHLKLQSVGQSDTRVGNDAVGGIATQINVNVGFALPVVIRQGAQVIDISLANPEFLPPASPKDPRPRLKVDILKSGTQYGAMGKIRVFWTPNGQDEREIGDLNNVNTYAETASRYAIIPLNENNVNNGKIRVVYQGAGIDTGKTFDEQVFPIGN